MSDEFAHDDHDEPATGVGVGMGGSCPVCRAPVALGQEFCLECGSPIRFTPRQRRQKQRSAPGAAAAPPASAGKGFPWVPFLVVLALVVAGVAAALVEGGDPPERSGETAETEEPLPTITNSVPTTEPTPSETVTLQDCDPAQPLDGTVPATTDPAIDTGAFDQTDVGTTDPSTGETIPQLDDGTLDELADPAAGATDPATGAPVDPAATDPAIDGTGATATVDQDGLSCDAGVAPDDGTGTTDPAATDPAGTAPADGASSTTWPSGTKGYTAIVFGFPLDGRTRANQEAAKVQSNGFEAGVLRSDDYSSLNPGFWVVFSGVFTTGDEAAQRAAAETRVEELKDAGYPQTYVKPITPR